MRIRGALKQKASAEGFKSDFADRRNPAETLEFPADKYGQSCPQHCPYPGVGDPSPLGDAIDVAGVARMLGCSPWTVRHRYIQEGLPHIRASAHGRLVFFRTQVLSWIVKRQLKGGSAK